MFLVRICPGIGWIVRNGRWRPASGRESTFFDGHQNDHCGSSSIRDDDESRIQHLSTSEQEADDIIDLQTQ